MPTRIVRALPVLLLAFIAGCASGHMPVAFTTAGGEAWTFDKLVEARVAPAACDAVTFVSEAGAVTTRPQGERVLARVPLRQGENRIEAECRKGGIRLGSADSQRWLVRLDDVPKARVRLRTDGPDVLLDGGASERARGRPDPLVAYEWRAHPDNPAPIQDLPAQGQQIRLRAPRLDGEYLISLRVTDGVGRSDESTTMLRVSNGGATEIDLAREPAAWIDGAIVYGVVPPLFGARGFADVTARLDDLTALGVTTLWLSPVTDAPEDDFGYAVTDHFAVRPRFGTEAELRELIGAAHARGLRVIIDFVPNHVSDRHPYYADAAERARSSPYFDFFARSAAAEAQNYFEWHNLKNLNFDHPEVQTMIIEAFAYWVREFDIDGFRVDVAWGPRERAPEFWPRWRAELKRMKPDLLLLAEASARDSYYLRNGFDAAYDWTDKLGEWAWRDAFEDPHQTARRLRAAIEASGPGPTLRFLENNDTGARFVTRHGPERTRVAAALLLTLPGIPSLYTGQEVGAAFEPYEEGPPIAWNDPHGLRSWYRYLIALRQQHPALRGPELRFLEAQSSQVLAYVRGGTILVLLNFSGDPQRVRVDRETFDLKPYDVQIVSRG